MASGFSGRLWAGRELVDRMARQSPARLAITVFAAVIAVFTGLLSTPFANHQFQPMGRHAFAKTHGRVARP